MNGEDADDVEKTLRDAGYSDSAVNEILKWYRRNNTERKA